jgi:Asp-tRNA(Asn)/Glu-tRNA(Gln) amidotransferase A subunit family amidase
MAERHGARLGMEELHRLSAAEAVRLICANVITSEELVTSCLDRIARREPVVEAWVHLDADYALSQAQRAGKAPRSGPPVGPLHGVPVAIKDIIDTTGLPTEHGTTIFAGRRPEMDAAVVQRLISAGAIVLGKTVTTELAFFGPGKTRNPHNPEHTPGGSSSGSAAAVADFHVPLALGTQTAGSIIRPASYCGVIGFKPTFGAVPRDGVLEQSPPLDTIGGYARSFDDIRLLMACMSDVPAGAEQGRTGKLRLAFVKSPAWPQGEDRMKEAFTRLVVQHRDIVEEVALPPDFDDTSGLQRAVQFRDIAQNYGPLHDANPGVLSAKLAEVIDQGRNVTDREYEAALARRDPLYNALQPILGSYDAILTPASTGPAPKGLGSTGSPAFNFLWTYLGQPAISVPLLNVDGMPLGVQLAGARGEDGKLIGTAERLMALVSV